MDTSVPTSETLAQQQAQQHPSSVSGGPQLRSRVTVVCAECKRLKLKCDRRTPCGSCTKRDAVARCIYSAAAAEKVDLHSLHNRLSQVESQLAQFSAPGARSHAYHPRTPDTSVHADRTFLAVGKSGSALSISLDDITSIWLEEQDLPKEILPVQELQSQPSCLSYVNPSQVKLEFAVASIPDQQPINTGLERPIPLLLPPMSAYFNAPSPSSHEPPCVTPRLMAHLPFAPRKRQRLYDNVEDVLKMYPCFNFKHFRDRAEAMFKWASEAGCADVDAASSPQAKPESDTTKTSSTQNADLARAIFFGPPSTTPFSPPKATKPSISFFAAVAAAFALGTLVEREAADEEARILAAAQGEGTVTDGMSTSRASSMRRHEAPSMSVKKNKAVQKETASSPSVLLALSQQALSLSEKSSPYDLDFLVTMILHVLYALHDGKVRVAHHLLPNVGKMVNIARIIGLDSDPDEFPGPFNLFEAESRRRLWWDIFYYDLFVSDYMGRSPLISDSEHTTRFPQDVDEDVFTPACTSIPLPRSPLSLIEPNVSDFKYFGLKCRLAQLIKDIKKRSFRDSLQYDLEAQERYSLEQAVSCANDIQQWLTDLPAPFRLDIDSDSNTGNLSEDVGDSLSSSPSGGPTVSPVLLAQRCELMVTAQRLLMKVYIPFLRPSNSHSCPTTHLHATVGVFDAAHAIIRAIRALCSMWKQRPDLKGKRPTPALFSFYSFGRILFDAAVVCAHSAIKYPTKYWVPTAVEDVNYALEILRDPLLNTGRGPMRDGVEGDVQESIMIISQLQKKIEMSRKGNPDALASRAKRKRDEVESDTERVPNGLHLPCTGGTVSSTNFERSPPVPMSGPGVVAKPTQASREKYVTPPEERRKPATPPVPPYPKRLQTEGRDPKSKDKSGKKPPYPQICVRVRPGKEPPFCKNRSNSSTSATPEPRINSESITSSTQSPCQPPTHGTDRSPHTTLSFAQPLQRTSSPGVQVIHRTLTHGLSEEGCVEFQVPFGTASQGQSRRSHLSQAHYIVSDEPDPPQYPKVSPGGPSYEQNSSHPSPLSFTPYSDVSSSYSGSGPGVPPTPQVSRTPSTHQQHSPPFVGEMTGSSGDYYLFNSQYGGNVANTPVPGMGIDPMTLHTGGENTSPSMGEVSRGSLFHHHHEKPHPVYLRRPSDHHFSLPQPQFSEPQHQPVVTRPWPHENPMQDNTGFSYGQFMTS